MKKPAVLISILINILLGVSSCVPSYQMSAIQVEVMNPSILTNPENIDTVAIFYRELSPSEAGNMPYIFHYESKPRYYLREKADTSIHYNDLYRICIDALVNYLDSTNYFVKVINCSDSFKITNSDQMLLPDIQKLCHKLSYDACIFVVPFQFNDLLLKKGNEYIDVTTVFPEFSYSTDMEYIYAKIRWSTYTKGDSIKKRYDQYEDLYYGNSVYPDFFGSPEKHKLLVENTAIYLGKSFGSKLIPSWSKTERGYCLSKNPEMMKAEEFCRTGEWLKAAEIYKQLTKSKNKDISTKAKYNMALVCEMEGNIDAAIDWINRSKSATKKIQIDHIINCNLYSKELVTRKKELELLKKQVRN